MHLEFSYLSDITGNPIFRKKVEQVRRVLRDLEKPKGLYPNFIHPETGKWGQRKYKFRINKKKTHHTIILNFISINQYVFNFTLNKVSPNILYIVFYSCTLFYLFFFTNFLAE